MYTNYYKYDEYDYSEVEQENKLLQRQISNEEEECVAVIHSIASSAWYAYDHELSESDAMNHFAALTNEFMMAVSNSFMPKITFLYGCFYILTAALKTLTLSNMSRQFMQCFLNRVEFELKKFEKDWDCVF